MLVKEVIEQITNHEVFHLVDASGKIVFKGNWIEWSTDIKLWEATSAREVHLISAVNDSENGLPTIRIAMEDVD